jgi:Zn-dependent protease
MSGGGIRIGRIFGITIRIAWSWLIILALVIWNLGSTFGQTHPEWGAGLTWGLAVVAALLFFGAVLVHELAHSLVAKARGIPVDDITLFIFGGVSEIEEQPDSPGGEFLMAILGPVTSLVIGAILVLLAGVAGNPREAVRDPGAMLGQLSPLTTLLLWLGAVNLLLGVFNLIPGFPLDGGRVLRSILWGLSGSLEVATRIASLVGVVIALAMIVGGGLMVLGVSIPFFGSGFADGLWLVLIGWFLFSASARHLRQGPRAGRAAGG